MVLWIAVKYRRHINWKLLWWPLVANSVFSLAGIWFQDAGTETLLRRILGITLVVLSIYFIFFSSRLVIRANLWTGLAAGAISGVCGGLMSIGGPPMVAYYLAATRSKEEYAATLQTYFIFSTVYIFCRPRGHGPRHRPDPDLERPGAGRTGGRDLLRTETL